VRISPEAYNSVLSLYKNPIMGLGEMALVAAIVYHAFNGIRIILIDFWGPATNSKVEHIQKPNKDGIIETSEKATYNHIKILWVVLVLWVIFVAGFAVRHLPNVFAHIGGH
jgi:succinate dehydrogenase/fumarate reductase, cytochrome b subunit